MSEEAGSLKIKLLTIDDHLANNFLLGNYCKSYPQNVTFFSENFTYKTEIS